MNPVLLLDVDGVLNAFAYGYEKRKVWLGEKTGAFHPTAWTKPFLKWAWENFEVFWCTAWFDRANQIADWAGLSHRPHLGDYQDIGDYKLNAVKKNFSSHDGKVIWLEDGIGKEAESWVKERKNFLYIFSDPNRGVSEAIVNKMSKFAGIPKMKGKR